MRNLFGGSVISAGEDSFVISNVKFKWIPEQDFEEQICVPSEILQYLDVIANPADEVKSK